MTTGSALLDLCGVDDVSPDVPAAAEIDGQSVAVFQVDDCYYVTQNLCTHGPGLMTEGYVEGREIECPFHQGKFDIISGQPTAPPCTVPLKTWPVEVVAGRICVTR